MATEAVNFTVNWGVEKATLKWEAPSTTNLLNWLIERTTGTSGVWTKLPELLSGVREFEDAGVAPGSVKYRVWAVVKQNAKEVSGTVQSPPPPPAEKIKIALSTDKTGVEVVKAPAGTAKVGFAFMKNLAGEGVDYASENYPLAAPYVPPVGFPVVDAQAVSSTGATIPAKEAWAGRVETVPAKKEEPHEPPVEEPPHEEPVTFKRGFDGGGWNGPQEVADLKKVGPNPAIRVENPSNPEQYEGTAAVIYLNSGGTSTNMPSHFSEAARDHRSKVLLGERILTAEGNFGYSTGGVKSLSTAAVVADAVAVVKKHPNIWAYEYLNEPGGSWFWGSSASSSENSAAYCAQLKAIHEAFVKEFGSKRPLLFASFDGGHAGENGWGKQMLKADPNVVNYVDAFTEHCYDGGSANPNSTLVHWNAVVEAHSLTGKPIAITEYGRPLQASTGDSPKSTEAQQAAADGAMVHQARLSGFVPVVTIYGYRGNSAPCYAIFAENDTPRPAVAAIASA